MKSKAEIQSIMERIHSLSTEDKLELLNHLVEEFKAEIFASKNQHDANVDLVNELYGAWKDMDEKVFDVVVASRSFSGRRIKL
jgi:hypothetical protein